MKKIYLVIFALLPILLHAEIIVTRHNGNIENVSDVDTTEMNVIYYIYNYQTKSIDRDAVVSIIYDDGHYVTISHQEKEVLETKDELDVRPEFAWADIRVGALHTFSDGSQGIIFYVDEKGHGLAVSLRETKALWDISRKRDMQDIYQIPNTEHATTTITQVGEGAIHTAAILKQLPAYLCPAAAWCVSQGEGWYLPTASELLILFQVANCRKGKKGPISQAIVSNGGVPLNGGWYWTCTESGKTAVINISEGGSCATENKSENNAVRAVRAF